METTTRYKIQIGYPKTDGIVAVILVSPSGRWRRDPNNKIGEIYTGSYLNYPWRKVAATIRAAVATVIANGDWTKGGGFCEETEEQWYAERLTA